MLLVVGRVVITGAVVDPVAGAAAYATAADNIDDDNDNDNSNNNQQH